MNPWSCLGCRGTIKTTMVTVVLWRNGDDVGLKGGLSAPWCFLHACAPNWRGLGRMIRFVIMQRRGLLLPSSKAVVRKVKPGVCSG